MSPQSPVEGDSRGLASGSCSTQGEPSSLARSPSDTGRLRPPSAHTHTPPLPPTLSPSEAQAQSSKSVPTPLSRRGLGGRLRRRRGGGRQAHVRGARRRRPGVLGQQPVLSAWNRGRVRPDDPDRREPQRSPSDGSGRMGIMVLGFQEAVQVHAIQASLLLGNARAKQRVRLGLEVPCERLDGGAAFFSPFPFKHLPCPPCTIPHCPVPNPDHRGAGRTAGPAAAVAAGAQHTCALWTSGTVECWGTNSYGQLGSGDYLDRQTPSAVSGAARFGCCGAGLAIQ